MLVGQEPRERHVDEPWVAVPALAVGEGELDRLGDEVHVLGAVVAERLELAALEDRERLQERRALRPRIGRVDEPAGARPRDGRRDVGDEPGQVGPRQPAAVGADEVDDPLRDLTLVERTPHAVERRRAIAARLGVDEPLQERRQLRLAQPVAEPRRPALGPVHGARRLPVAAEELERVCGAQVEHVPVRCELERGRGDLGEAPRAPARERRDPGGRRAGHDRDAAAERHVVAEARAKRLERCVRAPRTETGDAPDLVGVPRESAQLLTPGGVPDFDRPV